MKQYNAQLTYRVRVKKRVYDSLFGNREYQDNQSCRGHEDLKTDEVLENV